MSVNTTPISDRVPRSDRFVGIRGLHDFKASLLHCRSRIHPEQELVFDDQNDGLQLLHIMASLPVLFGLSP
jgi:hypothetical protein